MLSVSLVIRNHSAVIQKEIFTINKLLQTVLLKDILKDENKELYRELLNKSFLYTYNDEEEVRKTVSKLFRDSKTMNKIFSIFKKIEDITLVGPELSKFYVRSQGIIRTSRIAHLDWEYSLEVAIPLSICAHSAFSDSNIVSFDFIINALVDIETKENETSDEEEKPTFKNFKKSKVKLNEDKEE